VEVDGGLVAVWACTVLEPDFEEGFLAVGFSVADGGFVCLG